MSAKINLSLISLYEWSVTSCLPLLLPFILHHYRFIELLSETDSSGLKLH